MQVRRRLIAAFGIVALAVSAFTGMAHIKDGTSNTLAGFPALDGSSKEPAYFRLAPDFDGRIAGRDREVTLPPFYIVKERDVSSPML